MIEEAASRSSHTAAVAAAWSRDELFPEPRCFLVDIRCTQTCAERLGSWRATLCVWLMLIGHPQVVDALVCLGRLGSEK